MRAIALSGLQRARSPTALDWHSCAGELENYTAAEIEFIVNEAARIALSQNRLVSNGDLLYAAGNNPPAHTAAAIEEMRNKWPANMGIATPKPRSIHPSAPEYPRALLAGPAPPLLHALGNLNLLRQPLAAIFCSNQCPGDAVSAT